MISNRFKDTPQYVEDGVQQDDEGVSEYETQQKVVKSKGKMSIGSFRLIVLAFIAVFCVGFSALIIFSREVRHGSDENQILSESSEDLLPVLGEYKIAGQPMTSYTFPTNNRVRSSIEKRNLTDDYLEKESQAFREFIDHVREMENPVFPAEPLSTGIVVTCKMDMICLMNLVYMLDHMNTKTPVELWLDDGEADDNLVEYITARWKPQLRVKFFRDIRDRYVSTFGPVDLLIRHFRLLFKIISRIFPAPP